MMRLLRLWRLGGADLQLLWFALRHERKPAWLWPAALALSVYALEPLNFAVPVLGVVDDLVIVPLALSLLLKMLPPEIRSDYARRAPAR